MLIYINKYRINKKLKNRNNKMINKQKRDKMRRK